jgi:hypothetical protein
MNGIFKNTFRLRSNSEYAKSSLVFKNSKKSNEYSSLMPTPTSQTYRKDNVNFLPKIVSKRKISSEYPKINKNELLDLKKSASNFFSKKTKSNNNEYINDDSKSLKSKKTQSTQNILRNKNSKKNS